MDNRRVACLDGLRGWASLVVVFSHLLQGILARPPGSSFATVLSSDLVYSSPLYLLMDGVSAVLLFFLISGFSLCIPSFQGRSAADVWKMAVFRPLRLYVPVVIAAMFAYVILVAGLMQNEPLALSTDNSWLANVYRVDPSIGNLLRTFMKLKFKEYNPVFWSMRPELICSLYIFAFLLLAKYTGTRIILHVLAIGISVRAGAFYPAFALGAALADLFVTFENARQSSTRTARHAFETAALVLFAVTYCWWVARPPYQTAPSSVRILPMFLLLVATLSGGVDRHVHVEPVVTCPRQAVVPPLPPPSADHLLSIEFLDASIAGTELVAGRNPCARYGGDLGRQSWRSLAVRDLRRRVAVGGAEKAGQSILLKVHRS